MVGGAIALQRLDPLIMVVDGGQGGAPRRHIGKTARSGLADIEHGIARHRIIAIEAVAARDAFGRAFDHGRKTPYRQAPGLTPLGEEIPIALIVAEQAGGLAEHRVSDVVRGHRIAVEMHRSEEHTSELQSLMRISYAVFRLKK